MQSSYPYTQAHIKLMRDCYASMVEKGEENSHLILQYLNSMKRKVRIESGMHYTVLRLTERFECDRKQRNLRTVNQ